MWERRCIRTLSRSGALAAQPGLPAGFGPNDDDGADDVTAANARVACRAMAQAASLLEANGASAEVQCMP